MGSLPPAKAGVGSAVNDTTREVGAALGVAVLGSVMSSTYRPRVSDAIAGRGVPARSPTPSPTRSAPPWRPPPASAAPGPGARRRGRRRLRRRHGPGLPRRRRRAARRGRARPPLPAGPRAHDHEDHAATDAGPAAHGRVGPGRSTAAPVPSTVGPPRRSARRRRGSRRRPAAPAGRPRSTRCPSEPAAMTERTRPAADRQSHLGEGPAPARATPRRPGRRRRSWTPPWRCWPTGPGRLHRRRGREPGRLRQGHRLPAVAVPGGAAARHRPPAGPRAAGRRHRLAPRRLGGAAVTLAHKMRDTPAGRILPGIIAEASVDPEMRRILAGFIADRRNRPREVMDRGSHAASSPPTPTSS